MPRLVAFLLSVSLVLAQSPLGTVTGLATDATGAAVANATVRLTSDVTGVQRETVTNEAGNYSFPNLPPGTYRLAATAAGFRGVESLPFAVAAFRTVRQDFGFEVASATQEVTVSEAISPVINVDTPSVSTSLSRKQILELPTNLRSVFNNAGDSGLVFQIMPLTTPGVLQVANGANFITPGAGPNSIKLRVDGIETNFGNFGSPDPVSQPSLESVEEFTANVVTNKAEFGGMGTVTTVTRSGGNQFHGGLFWYVRNSAFDARNTFAVAKPFQNIHNFGATLSGPVRPNKTFFFANYDSTRGSRAYLFTANVPTLAQRAGNFGGTTLRNPFQSGTPFEGGRIPASLLSPLALRSQELFFPLPNFGGPDLVTGNYRAAFNGPESHGIYEARLDQNWTSAHSSFARYQFKSSDYDIPGARSPLPPTSVGTSNNLRESHLATVGDTVTLSATLFNEFRAGVVSLSSRSDIPLRGDALLPLLGITGLPARTVQGIPNLGIAGYSTVNQTLLNPVIDGHWQLSDNVSWVVGRHGMKFGAEVIRWFVNRWQPVDARSYGNFSFTNRYTGSPYADFLLGLPTSVTRLDPFPTQRNRWYDFAFYAQDDWKVTSRFTLNLGLRYELNQPAQPEDDNLYNFDLQRGAVVIPNAAARQAFSPFFPSNVPVLTADQVGLDGRLRRTDRNNFAPRFGFSWQPFSDGRTVVRGGYGIYYNHYSGAVPATLATGPFGLASTYNNPAGNPTFTFANPFSAPFTAGTLDLSGVNPNLRHAYSMQYSLSVEREVLRDLGVRITYIGSRGNQLAYGRNVNQPLPSTSAFAQSRRPYPLLNNVTYYDNGAYNSYNGLQTQLSKRFSRGLQLASTWVWAKQISEVDDGNGIADLNTVIENAYDRRRDRADVYAVPRHQWLNQILYELPGRGILLGGWQANVLFNLQSGHFLNATFTGSDPSNTNVIGGRPDVVGELRYPRTLAQWFDRGAFAPPPANSGRFGNAGRNLIEGPGFVLFNAGLQKEFRFERIGVLQLAVTFQNIMNHVNFGQPNTTVNVAQGGAITSTHIFPPAGSPRTGQLGLRYTF